MSLCQMLPNARPAIGEQGQGRYRSDTGPFVFKTPTGLLDHLAPEQEYRSDLELLVTSPNGPPRPFSQIEEHGIRFQKGLSQAPTGLLDHLAGSTMMATRKATASQAPTGLLGHLANVQTHQPSEPSHVSSPNGSPRPFSPLDIVRKAGYEVVSSPNGSPRPFSQISA